jgi:hypothetical protein
LPDEGFCPLLDSTEIAFALILSHSTPVAWIETEYWAGLGWQFAVVWHKGAIAVGPTKTGNGVPLLDGAINHALRYLGVRRQGELDEFDTMQLGWYRSNEEWIGASK